MLLFSTWTFACHYGEPNPVQGQNFVDHDHNGGNHDHGTQSRNTKDTLACEPSDALPNP